MKSIYDFIIQPLGGKYSNTVKIGSKEIVVNTKIENWKFVNRLAIVVETPTAFNSKVKIGDTIVIHQNVFRTFYDMKGQKKKSRSYFKDNLYFCSIDQIYLYKNNDGWNSFGDRWVAQIKVDGKNKHLGYYVDKQDAIDVRKAAEKQYGFHANHGRVHHDGCHEV